MFKDSTHNRIPEQVRTVHLIAVCGTAMGALACMLKDLGYSVTGSDQKVYPPMSTYLADRGVQILEGYAVEHLDGCPDLVVVGNAVTRDNPEAVRMRELKLCHCSMPQALNHFAAAGKRSLVVTGTHGKTTTSALLAWMLETAGLDPSFMVGGILKNFDRNYRLGNGPYMVFEGDEYDTAYFDKGPKFMHFDPAVAILTSVEFDHADIFTDLEHVKSAFGRFIGKLSGNATLVAWDADPNIDELLDRRQACRVHRYGRRTDSRWRLGRVKIDPPWTVFEVFRNNTRFGKFRTRMMGEHNLLNALAVIGAVHRLSVSAHTIGKALESFEGVRRRQEIRGTRNGVTVLDDFAHHPTAVRETIRAAKPHFPEGRLIAVFEPRTNTSMRNVFQEIYPRCFDGADIVCIRRPPLLSKIPEGERFSSERLVDALTDRGLDARFFTDTDSIIQFVAQATRPSDGVLIMSNGGFDNIHERLLEAL